MLDTSLVKRLKPCGVCEAHISGVYPTERPCWNRGRFWVRELGLRLCGYHLGDVLGLAGKPSYSLERLDW